eukprot:3015182-Amphidinium_carterae.1
MASQIGRFGRIHRVHPIGARVVSQSVALATRIGQAMSPTQVTVWKHAHACFDSSGTSDHLV